MAVHSQDVVRSPRDAKVCLAGMNISSSNKRETKREKREWAHTTIELRFTERIANPKQAIDIGIYKTTVYNKGRQNASYIITAAFMLCLRKEGSDWKILVDTDSSEGNSIGEKDFIAASPL